MKRFQTILLIVVLLVCVKPLMAQNHPKKPQKVTEVFLAFVSKELALTPAESEGIKPLVKQYLNERNKTARLFKDPLEREQQVLSLKMKYRTLMSKIIGPKKATLFFRSEQNFRRKVKEVLEQRKESEKKVD